VVPDGCLDLIWLDGDLIVAGPDDVPHLHTPRPEPRSSAVVGVRFRPGRAGPLLRESPSRLRNQRVAYSDLGPSAVDRLAERVADADRPAEVLRLLVTEVRARALSAEEPDAVGTGCADLMEASRGRLAVATVAGELGVSERHLRRRATDALGYGPKTFARIVRFQRALGLLQAGHAPATAAATAGYADQAHLTREVTALAGRTPTQAIRAPAESRPWSVGPSR
jgi:AraC-like DNA-binding protein